MKKLLLALSTIFFLLSHSVTAQSYDELIFTIKKALGDGVIASVSIQGAEVEYTVFRQIGCFDKLYSCKFDLKNINTNAIVVSEAFDDERRGILRRLTIETKKEASNSIRTIDYFFSSEDYSLKNGNVTQYIPPSTLPDINNGSSSAFLYYVEESKISPEELVETISAIQKLTVPPSSPVNISSNLRIIKNAINKRTSRDISKVEYWEDVGALVFLEQRVIGEIIYRTVRTFIPLYTIGKDRVHLFQDEGSGEYYISFNSKSDANNSIIQTHFDGGFMGESSESFESIDYDKDNGATIDAIISSEQEANVLQNALIKLIDHAENVFHRMHDFDNTANIDMSFILNYLNTSLDVKDYMERVSRKTELVNGCSLHIVRNQGTKNVLGNIEINRIDLSRIKYFYITFNSSPNEIVFECSDGDCAFSGRQEYMRGRQLSNTEDSESRIIIGIDIGYIDLGMLNQALLLLSMECKK